jgi:nicotinate-nucleotide pyrophosphorylase (carboxylating)
MITIDAALQSILSLVRAALAEDIGDGDRTTLWAVPFDSLGCARVIARAEGIIAGTEPFDLVLHEVDAGLVTRWNKRDGEHVAVGQEVMEVHGCLQSILMAERTALNFLGRLSGIATMAGRFAEAVSGTGAQVVDTRKTTPGWRALEKAAVAAGGCQNHRKGLFDMVLVKENHLRAGGGIGPTLEAVRGRALAEGLEVEIEVATLAELGEALVHKPDRILLDNMSTDELGEAVRIVRDCPLPRPVIEASGGVTVANVRDIAETGVDMISAGCLTHSASPLDLSLLVDG